MGQRLEELFPVTTERVRKGAGSWLHGETREFDQ
jgi:hypothetical protein